MNKTRIEEILKESFDEIEGLSKINQKKIKLEEESSDLVRKGLSLYKKEIELLVINNKGEIFLEFPGFTSEDVDDFSLMKMGDTYKLPIYSYDYYDNKEGLTKTIKETLNLEIDSLRMIEETVSEETKEGLLSGKLIFTFFATTKTISKKFY